MGGCEEKRIEFRYRKSISVIKIYAITRQKRMMAPESAVPAVVKMVEAQNMEKEDPQTNMQDLVTEATVRPQMAQAVVAVILVVLVQQEIAAQVEVLAISAV